MKKRKQVPYNPYRVYGDVSGTIRKGDISVGTILFNERFRKNFIDGFYGEFPNLKRFKEKANRLKKEKLKEVISYMNDKRIHMACINCDRVKMNWYRTHIENKFKTMLGGRVPSLSFFEEKMLALFYYYAFRCNTYEKWRYDGQICIESQIKIDKTLSKLSSVSQKDGYQFYLSINFRRMQHLLKFADFVASAGRRLDTKFLESLYYFKILPPDIADEDIKHVFGLRKLESDINRKKRLYQTNTHVK